MFKPRVALLDPTPANLLLKFLTQEGPRHHRLTVPLRVNVPDQPIPVDFSITAQVTASDLLFHPSSLDFGDCSTAEQTGIKVNVTNMSALPQSFAFLDLLSGVSVSPNDGFGNLLPGDTLELIIRFRPLILGPQRFSVTCTTLADRTFTLPCRANGVSPAIELSANELVMPATALLDTSTVSTILRNTTDASCDYEFGLPVGSDVSLCPRVGTLKPRETVRLKVDYSPPESLAEEHPLPSTSGQEVRTTL